LNRPVLLLEWLVVRHSRMVIATFLLAAVACGAATEFRIGHSYLDWIDTDGAPYKRYQKLAEEFGDAETLLAVFELQDLNSNTIAAYFGLLDRLRAIDGVVGVYEPAGMLLGSTEGHPPEKFEIETLSAGLQSQAPDYRSAIISRDARTAAVLILVDSSKPASQGIVLDTVRTGFSEIGIPVDLGGTVYFSESLKDAIATDMALVNTLLIVAAIGLLVYFFGSFLLAACVAAGIGLSVLYSLALCMALGLSINLLTLLLLPLIFCVTLTTAVHLFARRTRAHWHYPYEIARIAGPSTIAALTTAIGCVAFLAAPQPIVARMGIVLPFGVLFSFVTTLLFVPALVQQFAAGRQLPPVRCQAPRFGRSGRRITNIALVGLAIGACAVLPRVSLNPDAIFFFAHDSAVIRSYDRIERDLTGMLVTELLIRSNDGSDVSSGAHRKDIEQLIRQLRHIPEMTAVVSGFGLQQLTNMGLPVASLGSRFFSADNRATRISLRLRNLGGRPYADIARDVATLWVSSSMTGLEYELTGIIPLIIEAQERLLTVQSLMLPAVMVSICAVIFAVFRSSRLLGLAVVANFIPLLLMAGSMVLLGITINSINLFVMSVMLGVIVDDTVHLLHAYRASGSMEIALDEVGTALWITSVIVCIAFASLLASHLIPLHEFGILSIVAVSSAWLCDVCLLPSLAKDTVIPA
jgi:uncharacterized protein